MITTAAANYILDNGFGSGINFITLGTGTTPADVTDTKLQTETVRLQAIANRTGNKLYYHSVLSNQMPAVAYKEIGIVQNGKLTKDTGSLIARTVQNFNKSISTLYILRYVFEFTGFTDITL